MDTESIQKTFKIFHFATPYAILIKLTSDIYLNKVLYLAKFWDVLIRCKINQKIIFLVQFRPFLNTSLNCSISDALE